MESMTSTNLSSPRQSRVCTVSFDLINELKSKQFKLQQVRIHSESLQGKLSFQDLRIQELKLSLQDFTLEQEELKSKADSLQLQLKSVELEADEIKTISNLKSQEIHQIIQQKMELKQKCQITESQIYEIQQKIDQYEIIREKMRKLRKNIIQKQDQALIQMKNKINEVNQQRISRENLTKIHEDLQIKKYSVSESLKSINEEISKKSDLIRAIANKIICLRQNVTELEGSTYEIAFLNKEMKAKNNHLAGDYQKAIGHLQTLKENTQKLERQIKDYCKDSSIIANKLLLSSRGE